MATTACPSCGRPLRVPDHLLGKQVKCPTCATIFTAETQSSAVLSSSEPLFPLQESAAPPSEPPKDRTRCPFCGEPIRRDLSRCPHCEENLEEDEDEDEDEDDRPWQRPRRTVRRDCEPHRGSMILVLGIISTTVAPLACCGLFGIVFTLIGLGLGIPAWVMGAGDLKKMRQGVMDPDGRGQTQGGMICGIVGTSLSGIGLLVFGAILVVWLIMVMSLRPVPPPPPPPPVAPIPPRLEAPMPAPRRLAMYLPGVHP